MPRGVAKSGERRPRGLGLWKIEAAERKARNAALAAAVYNTAKTANYIMNPDIETKETDGQIETKLNTRFKVLKDLTESICAGTSRALVVSGPPGLSKSFTIEEVVNKSGAPHIIHKGFMRPTGLYATLYTYRHPGNVIIIDDCDSVFGDTTSLNILKAACDTTEDRIITWGCDTKMEDEEGERLPSTFIFEGSVILITNFDFEEAITNGHRYGEHFMAMMSRAHYISMEMRSRRDYLVKIKMTIDEGMLLNRGINAAQQKACTDFIFKNAAHFRELSLRTALKIADLQRMNPKHWQDFAKVTMFKKGAL